MADTTLTPRRLWKNMSPTQRLSAADAFWRDEQAADDQIQAVMLIAQQKKFRPKSVLALELERKAKHLASIGTLTDALAARILIVYHLAQQRPMMKAFLDELGIAHEEGLIESDDVKPDAGKLRDAAARIAREFPADAVSLYLNTLRCQDPQTWGGLAEVMEGLPTGG